MSGVLLNARTGQAEAQPELLAPSGLPVSMQGNLDRGWHFDASRAGGLSKGDLDTAMGRAPAHILDMLERGRHTAGP